VKYCAETGWAKISEIKRMIKYAKLIENSLLPVFSLLQELPVQRILPV
jgi:hypothetical protein